MKSSHCLKTALMLSAMSLVTFAHAAPTASALVYMNPDEYTNQAQIGGDENGVWITTGTLVAPIAQELLAPLFASVGVCQGTMTADALVWIKPTMDYNSMMTNYYGNITAEVYSGSGQFIATYKGEATHSGAIDVEPERQIALTYRQAMQQAVEKMQAGKDLPSQIAQSAAGNNKLPCSMVGTLVPQQSVLDNVVDQFVNEVK